MRRAIKDPAMYKDLPQKLQQLCRTTGCTQMELSKRCGVSQSMFNSYCRGVRIPTVKTLYKIASAFGMSPEELLNTSNNDDVMSKACIRNHSFAFKLRKLISEKAISQIECAKLIGISRQTISYYLNGATYPRSDVLNRICNTFNIEPSYFDSEMENEEKENVVFYVEKLPSSMKKCPFSVHEYINDNGCIIDVYYCRFGGTCNIESKRCTHLKELSLG